MNLGIARVSAFVLGALAFGTFSPVALHAAEKTPFLVVDGDGWLTSNADYRDDRWMSINPARAAFGLQLSERNDLPFDRGTAGATFWVRNGDCPALFEGFAGRCGWQLGLAVTQFRSIVVGGQGMEVDGFNSLPYARVVNSSLHGEHVAGLLTNSFVDFSGVDSPAQPAWFAGFDVDRDTFTIRRASPGAASRFTDVVSVDRDGNAVTAGASASSQMRQDAPAQWATRARLIGGHYTFHFARAFSHVPVCVATSEAGATLRVTPSAAACDVSTNGRSDTSMVDIIAVGNPE